MANLYTFFIMLAVCCSLAVPFGFTAIAVSRRKFGLATLWGLNSLFLLVMAAIQCANL